MRARAAVAGLLFAILALPVRAQEILVFAAASLTESLEEIGKAYQAKSGTAVRLSMGASSDLARQIQAGAPADVFFSADTAKMDALEKAGLVRHEDRREFLSNRLAVVALSDSRKSVNGPRDLLQFSKIALADPSAVPVGIYTKKWLEGAGVWKEIEERLVPTLDARAALAAAESGGVEAAVVYTTDAKISKKVRVLFETSGDPAILYSVAPVARAGKSAADFVAFLQGKEAAAVFSSAGFLVLSKK
jgi:molybdate transport system substrate-binding protein